MRPSLRGQRSGGNFNPIPHISGWSWLYRSGRPPRALRQFDCRARAARSRCPENLAHRALGAEPQIGLLPRGFDSVSVAASLSPTILVNDELLLATVVRSPSSSPVLDHVGTARDTQCPRT